MGLSNQNKPDGRRCIEGGVKRILSYMANNSLTTYTVRALKDESAACIVKLQESRESLEKLIDIQDASQKLTVDIADKDWVELKENLDPILDECDRIDKCSQSITLFSRKKPRTQSNTHLIFKELEQITKTLLHKSSSTWLFDAFNLFENLVRSTNPAGIDIEISDEMLRTCDYLIMCFIANYSSYHQITDRLCSMIHLLSNTYPDKESIIMKMAESIDNMLTARSKISQTNIPESSKPSNSLKYARSKFHEISANVSKKKHVESLETLDYFLDLAKVVVALPGFQQFNEADSIHFASVLERLSKSALALDIHSRGGHKRVKDVRHLMRRYKNSAAPLTDVAISQLQACIDECDRFLRPDT